MENTENKKAHPLNIVVLIVRWWKVLLITGIVAAVLSAGVSMLITPRFKSSVILMPTSSNALSQMVMLSNNNERLDATQFGDDMKVDQMLQILNSREMKKHVVETFNLAVHYAIDTTSKYWKTKLYDAVKNSCQFSRTDFMGVQITVIDEDPQFAADMANEIADYYDVLKRKIIKQRTEEGFAIIQNEMDKTEETIALLVDSLSFIMSHGIYDYESQSERLMQQYAKEIASGNSAAVKRMKDELQILEQWAPIYISVRDRMLFLKESQMYLQQKLQGMRADADYALPQKFIVESAVASDKKAYPKRLTIVIMTTICTLALAMLLIICQESIKQAYAMIRKDLADTKK
ncbi:MAG: hypothetical protein LBH82_04110 [Bacteroidales bacterium]|jgi:capsular polysaccharide biosynthesis protein|nr:hypothetical protein [Bacteroidales bacterium]